MHVSPDQWNLRAVIGSPRHVLLSRAPRYNNQGHSEYGHCHSDFDVKTSRVDDERIFDRDLLLSHKRINGLCSAKVVYSENIECWLTYGSTMHSISQNEGGLKAVFSSVRG